MNLRKSFEKQTGWDYQLYIDPSGIYTGNDIVKFSNGYCAAYSDWLETHLSEAVKMIEFYADDKKWAWIVNGKAKDFLEKLKEVKK